MNVLTDIKQSIACMLAIVCALFAGVFIGGPALRAILGVPAGFREDFVSRQANLQALIVQLTSVGLVLILAAIFRARATKEKHRIADTIAITAIVAVGFMTFRLTYEAMPVRHDLEYYNARNGMLIVLATPLLFAIARLITTRSDFKNLSGQS
jgi:hypothetical protein